MKLLTITVALIIQGCSYWPAEDDWPESNNLPVYKYNPYELKYELTREQSQLKYNVFENEWVYVK